MRSRRLALAQKKDYYIQRTGYSGLTLNQDKATKPQTVQIVRQRRTGLKLIHYSLRSGGFKQKVV